MLVATALGRTSALPRRCDGFTSSSTLQPARAAALERYWNLLPFRQNSQPAAELNPGAAASLASDDPALAGIRRKFSSRSPSGATTRSTRTQSRGCGSAAYQKPVVMKYIDNLISWGDQLFQRDTIESINEATLLYPSWPPRFWGQSRATSGPRPVSKDPISSSAPRGWMPLATP